MPDWKVPLSDLRFDEADIDAVAAVYRSGWLTMGERTQELEAAFARYTGADHAVAVSNGTAALQLACNAADAGPGEVIVPSLTFVASAAVIRHAGAVPVFADIRSVSEPWLSADAVEAALTPRTTAVMAVHYGGHPGDVGRLRELCDAHGAALLEDAAHAAGSRLGDEHLGTLGRAGAFSFFSNKNVAIGEGGMLVTGDPELAERARLLRSHGMTTLTWDRHQGRATGYDVVAVGFNFRMDEARAALALRRLGRLDSDNESRARLDAAYRDGLAGVSGVTLTLEAPPGASVARHIFTIVLDPALDRDRFREQLAERGVQTSVHFPPVHRLSAFLDSGARLPVTEDYAARAVTLPLFPEMTEAQQECVIDAVKASVA